MRLVPLLLLVLGCVMVASLHVGLRLYDPATVLAALRGSTGPDALIIASLRVPRTLVGAVAGAALGLSGLLMQRATRNPLAEPGLLGVNAGAAFAVTLGITAFGAASLAQIGLLAILGALAATAAVFGIAVAAGRAAGPATLLLAGVTVAGMLASLTQLMLLVDETALETLLFWLSGGFADRGTDLLRLGLPALLAGLAGALLLAPGLDALGLDDDSARAIGVRVARVRIGALGLAALLAAGAVAMAGPVAFLGLLAPHIARRLQPRSDSASLVVTTCLAGAILAVAADIAARLVVAPGEAPVSAVLALVGVPLLVALLRRRREAVL
ncbi:MAG: iron ABC transporter permease [Rhodobacteraceae bacterium]|nr:iron ABC transporter permease [Paracoccaceae bacterium]